jgi:hypothetical protein
MTISNLHLQLRNLYELDPKKCFFCQTVLPYKKRVNKFCSQSCSASNNNKGVRRHGGDPRPCAKCGTPTRNPRYCSIKCYSFDIEGWLKGEVDGGNSGKLGGCKSPIREYLRTECGNKCTKCGWNEVHPITGKVPLEVNHIDGNAHNNRRENLEVICPNCHSLTPNFRGLNKKSSRGHRGKNASQ